MRDIENKIDNTAPASTGRLPAEQFNAIKNELKNLVASTAIVLDPAGGADTDLKMIAQAVSRAASGARFGQDSGAANAYVLSSPSGPTGFVMPKELFRGLEVVFRPGHSNTEASTINAWGLGIKPLLDHNAAALVGGEVILNRRCVAHYEPGAGQNGAFLLAPESNALLLSSSGAGAGASSGTSGAGTSNAQTAIFDIASAHRYNLATDLVARGFDLSRPITVVATLRAGSILGSSRDGGAPFPVAFDTGSGYQNGSSLKLVVESGAHIVGAAGNGANGEASGYGNGVGGGDAVKIQYAITIDNLGVIAGGGGGGARYGASNANWAGNNGVSGGAYGAGIHVATPAQFKATYYYYYAIGYWDSPGNYAGGGAAGGAWGQPGSSAGGGTVGGAAGKCIQSGANLVTWLNTGARYGTLNN